MRYGPSDFGYTFVKQSDSSNNEVSSRKRGGVEEEKGEEESTIPEIAASDSKIETTAADASAISAGGSSTKRDDKDKPSSSARKASTATATSAAAASADDPLRKSSRAGDSSNKPYIYTPPKRSGRGGGNGDMSDDDKPGGGGSDSMVALLSGCGTCCCCISAALIIAGGIMIAYENSTTEVSNESLVLAGIIVLVIAVAAFLLGCCACCFGCLSACAGGGDGGGGLGGMGLGGGGHGDDHHHDVKVQFRRLNDRYEKAEDALNHVHLDVIGGMKEVREAQKKEDQKKKDEEKKKKDELETRVKKDLEAGLTVNIMRRNYRPITFLVRFDGDLMCSSMELLRKQVSIIVNCGRPGVDRAVVVVTSPGGAVPNYGLAASQLVRIRKAGMELIICVDTIAASGGYMMASVGDTVYAAPFAIIGSIGVVTQIPNFQRFLNKHDIDAFLFTAGKYKRTIDMIGDVTEEGKAKMQEDLDDIHRAFKDHVALARPRLRDSIEEVATGEYWMAVQAKELGLVDAIMTSDEYLETICTENEIIEIIEKKHKPKWASFPGMMASSIKSLVDGMSTQQYRTPAPMAMS